MDALAVQPDEQLVRDVLAGDREDYGTLVRRYERHVHATAWAILRDHHLAQDVAQETFIKAYDQLAALRNPRTFGSWIVTIARRAATDRARAKKRLVFVPELPGNTALDAPAEEDAALVLDALARLPDAQQQVILLRYFDGLAVADIANLLGCPVGTVTKQLSRAVARLREHLKETP